MSAYCERADIESVFGALNVSKWADLDNDGSSASITARITKAITSASEEIDDKLRLNIYTLPLADAEGDAPQTIKELAATLAGCWLYESRGVTDSDPETGRPLHRLQWHRSRADRVLLEIISGQRRIDAVVTSTTDPIPTAPAEDA